jgi:hypothetical protein
MQDEHTKLNPGIPWQKQHSKEQGYINEKI